MIYASLFQWQNVSFTRRRSGVRISQDVPKKCRINSVVECFVANENVIGSNPISCSKVCLVNSVVECLFYTEKVGSSNLSRGTKVCVISSTDRIRVFETQDGGSIPSQGAKFCQSVSKRKSRYLGFFEGPKQQKAMGSTPTWARSVHGQKVASWTSIPSDVPNPVRTC